MQRHNLTLPITDQMIEKEQKAWNVILNHKDERRCDIIYFISLIFLVKSFSYLNISRKIPEKNFESVI